MFVIAGDVDTACDAYDAPEFYDATRAHVHRMTDGSSRSAVARSSTCGIGSDWIGLDWIGLDWIGLDWIGLDWIGFD